MVQIEGSKLRLNGHVIPYITVSDVTDRFEGSPPSTDLKAWANESQRLMMHAVERGERIFDLTVDDRFGHRACECQVLLWGWFLAQSMAASAGYTSHGENSRPINRRGPSRK